MSLPFLKYLKRCGQDPTRTISREPNLMTRQKTSSVLVVWQIVQPSTVPPTFLRTGGSGRDFNCLRFQFISTVSDLVPLKGWVIAATVGQCGATSSRWGGAVALGLWSFRRDAIYAVYVRDMWRLSGYESSIVRVFDSCNFVTMGRNGSTWSSGKGHCRCRREISKRK